MLSRFLALGKHLWEESLQQHKAHRELQIPDKPRCSDGLQVARHVHYDVRLAYAPASDALSDWQAHEPHLQESIHASYTSSNACIAQHSKMVVSHDPMVKM